MIRFISVLTILIASLSISTAQQALWMRYSAISPDGSMIAFAFQGDLWVVSAKGGKADRITNNDAYDVSPVWSPDGKNIAFASDRHGNMDIFIMSSKGGPRVISLSIKIKEAEKIIGENITHHPSRAIFGW